MFSKSKLLDYTFIFSRTREREMLVCCTKHKSIINKIVVATGKLRRDHMYRSSSKATIFTPEVIRT